jgi:hypothetical protein
MRDRKQDAREKAAQHFLRALEAGDLETIGEIFKLAETDPELEKILLELGEEIDSEDRAKLLPS